jgi:hypothetical protein
MKTILALLALAALAVLPVLQLHAQTAPPAVAAPVPVDPLAGIALLIPVITPLLVAAAKKLADKFDAEIPGWILPLLCPLLGVGLVYLQGWATGAPSHLLAGLVLGAAGSFVREAQDQFKQAAGPSGTSGVAHLLVLGLLLSGLGLLPACTSAQLAAAKPTAISLAQPAGYEIAKIATQHWPTKAPAIIGDVRALLTDALGTGTILAPAQLTTFENSEAAKLGLTAADLQTLDGVLQTGVVALQAQYGADLKAGLGVTATAVLTNFNAGLAQAGG